MNLCSWLCWCNICIFVLPPVLLHIHVFFIFVIIQDVQMQAKDDINALNKQIQGLQSDLNKKDYDLQVIPILSNVILVHNVIRITCSVSLGVLLNMFSTNFSEIAH